MVQNACGIGRMGDWTKVLKYVDCDTISKDHGKAAVLRKKVPDAAPFESG